MTEYEIIEIPSSDEEEEPPTKIIKVNSKQTYCQNIIDEEFIDKENDKQQTFRKKPLIGKETSEELVELESIEDIKSSEMCSGVFEENKPSLANEEIQEFLKVCEKQVLGSQHEKELLGKFTILMKLVDTLTKESIASDSLKQFLSEQIIQANLSIATAIISFKDVYQYIKSLHDSENLNLSPKDIDKVNKLEKLMKKLISKIKQLEESEVNFDTDDSDSPYIQQDRYMQRLSLVYEKYCKILKKNPHSGRLTYERLDFVSSSFKEINAAINKKYKNNSNFPTYDELDSFINKVIEEEQLKVDTNERKVESKYCFKKLGDLLQIRRKKELYETHFNHILNGEDPAIKDKNLDEILRTSLSEGRMRLDNLCQEFVKKQLSGDYLSTNEVDIESESEKGFGDSD